MHITLRRAFKVAGWSFGTLLLLLCIFLGLLLFPGFLFAHRIEHENLVVYSNQNLSGSAGPILREINQRLATSEINAPAITHRIFFGHDAQIFGAVQGARAEMVFRTIGLKPSATYNVSWPPRISHIVTFDVPDTAHDALRRKAWPGQFNMTHILTHEVAHTLVLAKLGIPQTSRLPMWKAEGYPEYVAMSAIRAQPGYSLRASVARILETDLAWLRNTQGDFDALRYDCIGKSYVKDENEDFWHTCYYLARVLVEYVLDRKGLSFEQLMQPSISEPETLRELLRDYHAGAL